MRVKKKPIHFSQMLALLKAAQDSGSLVNIKAWKSDGSVRSYRKWKVVGDHWRGGITRIMDPQTREVRQVPQILIFELMGHRVYL